MNEFTDAIKERMNNSFSGPYTLFFIILNWPLFMFMLTGDDSAQTRIDNISSHLANGGLSGFLFPLLATLAYIIVVPIIISLIELYKARVHAVKQTKLEKIDQEFNRTWEYKFTLVKSIGNRLMLQTNSVISSSRFEPDHGKVFQKCINALLEADNKDIHQHFSELRERNLV